MKIVDKIEEHNRNGQTFYSFEFFPPRTEEGLYNLYQRIDRMATLEPDFIDITWRCSTKKMSMDIAASVHNLSGVETMIHLCCADLDRDDLRAVLQNIKDSGVMNILALRGDPPLNEEYKAVDGGFRYAYELVKFIREEFGDYFGISVAGYPESHCECGSYEESLQHLKMKVDAGADFVVTQLFFDVDIFLKFVADCREMGITVPIIPGIMPIQTFRSFQRMTSLSGNKISVPQDILDDLQPIKENDEEVQKYGVQLGIRMCKELIKHGVSGIHFYTINLEKSVTEILWGLGLVSETTGTKRQLPFKQSANCKRGKETVRPIFWANRPKSYIDRTMFWDQFPNGRWGDHTSPAYGELNDYHLSFLHVGAKFDRKSMWGQAPQTVEDIYNTFVSYCQGKINKLPWHEEPMATESQLIRDPLVRLNRNGFLTINSQPAVNGVPSTDKIFGWGQPGGYVYQKAYLELFCSPANKDKLVERLQLFPNLTYQICDVKGNMQLNFDQANAVTWGVFPGREIVQPTIVDPVSFRIWKDEAYGLWLSQWASIYDAGSCSRNMIQEIHDTFYLVNIVDNDYVRGDILAVFEGLLTK